MKSLCLIVVLSLAHQTEDLTLESSKVMVNKALKEAALL